MKSLIVGVNGFDIIKYCNEPLSSSTSVVIVTLNVELPYRRAPYLCMDAVGHQRYYELKNAFSIFEVSKLLVLDYPTEDDIELERLFVQIQMHVLFASINTIYFSGENVIVREVCNSIRGDITKVQFLNQESSLSNHPKKGKSLLELRELL